MKNKVDKEEVLTSLCAYDERNPDNVLDGLEEYEMKELYPNKNCMCDNCFYGRTKLAEFILEVDLKKNIFE